MSASQCETWYLSQAASSVEWPLEAPDTDIELAQYLRGQDDIVGRRVVALQVARAAPGPRLFGDLEEAPEGAHTVGTRDGIRNRLDHLG
jgi:hypothetical protein